jgi:TRAP-type C4-dicarboxylate transport system substrate-binding protein
MKLTLKKTALTLVTATAAMLSLSAAAQTTLRYSNWLPEGYPVRTQILEPWFAEVTKVTQGRVKVETTPKVVGTVPGQFDVIRDGLADIALIVPGYTPGRFELTEVFELPFLGDVAEFRSPATWRIYEKELAKYNEFKGVRVLSVFTGTAAQVYTSKKEIRNLDDFKGVKLRSPQAATSQAITLLGGVPVAKPVPEIYELASGGVIDGGVIVAETIVGFKLQDVLKKVTLVPGGLANTTLLVAMNEDKWNALSKEDQAAIQRVSGESLAKLAGRVHDESQRAAFETVTKSNATIIRMSAAETETLKARLAPIEKSWAEKARKKGVTNPEGLIEALRKDIAAGNK